MSNDKVYKTSEAERARKKAYHEANKEKIRAKDKARYEANKEKMRARNKAYHEANKEKIKAYQKAYHEANKEKIRAKDKAYREANKEKIRARRRAHYQANKEKLKAKARGYREANEEKIKAYLEANREARLARSKARYTSDIPHKLFQMVKHASKRVLRKFATKQEAMDLLGCTFEEYKEYLESKFQPGMTWENHTVDGWHIDHILPLKESEVSEEEKLKRLHYTNTQPLWAKDNKSKGNKTVYNPED